MHICTVKIEISRSAYRWGKGFRGVCSESLTIMTKRTRQLIATVFFKILENMNHICVVRRKLLAIHLTVATSFHRADCHSTQTSSINTCNNHIKKWQKRENILFKFYFQKSDLKEHVFQYNRKARSNEFRGEFAYRAHNDYSGQKFERLGLASIYPFQAPVFIPCRALQKHSVQEALLYVGQQWTWYAPKKSLSKHVYLFSPNLNVNLFNFTKTQKKTNYSFRLSLKNYISNSDQ